MSSRYSYEPLREGDTVIVNRPPSLWQGSCEPMIVLLWDRECIGLSPHNCADFNADFDGDEVQVYPVSELDSKEECKSWAILTEDRLGLEGIKGLIPHYHSHHPDFQATNYIRHSTYTMAEICGRQTLTALDTRSRMKQECVYMCARMDTGGMASEGETNLEAFYRLSIEGIVDIMTQQLSQGEIGRVTRAARLACAQAGRCDTSGLRDSQYSAHRDHGRD